ncbi:MAG TPA: hypothetical protein VEA44_16195 [Caulobacter sp.]|nr:hypothetical protein [Caulobacter sp.]
MARAAGFQNAFNAGELEEGAWSRSDLAQHAHGMALGLNLVGSVAGPALRAPGTWFVGLSMDQAARSILIPFARDPGDAQLIEMGPGVFRVRYADGSPVMDGGSPLEVAHGWVEADLDKLAWDQNGDVLILTHADGTRQRRIKRLAPDSWVIDDYDHKNGPWRSENVDRTFTLTVTGTSTVCTEDPNVGSIAEGETVTLTASAALFDDPGHVGSLWRLRQNDGNHGSESWTPRPDVKIGQFVLSAGRIYSRVSGGPQPSADLGGLTMPIHESGTVSDGRYNFLFMNDGAGVVEITAISSATVATGTVKRPIPLKDGQSTSYWSEGAWSDHRGYPTAKPAFREERLALAGSLSEPDKLFLSRTAGFTADDSDFTPGLGTGLVIDSDAVSRFAGDAPCRVVWLMSLPYLIAGTTAGPVMVTGASIEEPIAPASYLARRLNGFACSRVPPVLAGDGAIYVQAGGKTLRELSINPDKGVNYRDLTVVAGHFGARGFAQLAWQGTENLCWARLSDGGLAAMTYHLEQNVYGLTRRVLAAGADQEEAGAWTVESIACLPGTPDTVWLIASRQKGEATQRAILRMADRAEGCFYDAAELYAGAPVSTVTGLDHLEGETVAVVADGAEEKGLVVSGGAVTLPNGRTASRIVVGLPYMSRYRSPPLDLGGPGNLPGGQVTLKGGVVVVRGVECLAGADDQARLEQVASRRRDEVAAPVPRRHAKRITFGGETAREVAVVVETDCGFDLAVHSLRYWGEVNA